MAKMINLNSLSQADLLNMLNKKKIFNAGLEARIEERQKTNLAPSGATRYMNSIAKSDILSFNNAVWFQALSVFPSSDNGISADEIVAGGNAITSLQVSLEAGFVWTGLIKTVFDTDFGTPTSEYIDPRNYSGLNLADGLSVSIIDESSGRSFMDSLVPLDQIGTPDIPFKPDRPMMLPPRASWTVTFNNAHPTKSYVPFLIFLGYRIRLEGQHELESLVTASVED